MVLLLKDIRVVLQGENIQAANTAPRGPPLQSLQLWLKGLAPKLDSIGEVTTAFCQWLGVDGKRYHHTLTYHVSIKHVLSVCIYCPNLL